MSAKALNRSHEPELVRWRANRCHTGNGCSAKSVTAPVRQIRDGAPARPLMPMSAVMWRLDRRMNDDVLALIDEGATALGFEHSLAQGCGSAGQCACSPRALRIWSIAGSAHYTVEDETDWGAWAGLVFPNKPVSLQRGSWHAHELRAAHGHESGSRPAVQACAWR